MMIHSQDRPIEKATPEQMEKLYTMVAKFFCQQENSRFISKEIIYEKEGVSA